MAGKQFLDGANREAFWRGHVDAWASRGQSLAGYCLEHGLSEGSFYYWRKKLEKVETCSGAAASFVELELAPPGDAALEVVLAHGRRVQVHPGFDEATLARVVSVLEAVSC